jgi:hypothetical protein
MEEDEAACTWFEAKEVVVGWEEVASDEGGVLGGVLDAWTLLSTLNLNE